MPASFVEKPLLKALLAALLEWLGLGWSTAFLGENSAEPRQRQQAGRRRSLEASVPDIAIGAGQDDSMAL